MILQLEHQHEVSQAPSSPKAQPFKQSVKKSRSSKKQLPPPVIVQPSQSIFFQTQSNRQTATYNFHIDGLEEIKKASQSELSQDVIEVIALRKKFSEERIYEAITSTVADFVGMHLRDFKGGVKQQLQSMFEGIHETVEAGIWDGRYEIGKKNNYFSINRKEAELVAHITEELVKRNIDNFRHQLDESEEASEFLSVSVSQRAKSEVQKTKKAQQFIKKIQEQQLKHYEFISKKKEEKVEMEVKSVQERKARQQQIKQQKRDLILKRMERHKEMVNLQREHKRKIQSQYLKFITSNKRVLHKEMEEKYEKQKIQEQKLKFKKMKELMEERRPISFDEINEHMDRYDELLYENQQYRKQKWQLKEHEMQIIAHKKPYRSKFYSLAAKSPSKDDYKELRTSLIQKKTDFSEHVKKNFMPRTDEKKQQQLQDLIRKINNHKKNVYHSRKYMQQGKRNLQKLHLLIGQLRAKNKIKQNTSLQTISEVKPQKRYKNYLEQIKQSNVRKDQSEVTVDYERKLQERDQQFVRMQAMMKQAKAKQQDVYLNSALQTLDFDTHMKGKKMVEHDFIEAANAKLAILKKYNLNKSQTLETKPQVEA